MALTIYLLMICRTLLEDHTIHFKSKHLISKPKTGADNPMAVSVWK